MISPATRPMHTTARRAGLAALRMRHGASAAHAWSALASPDRPSRPRAPGWGLHRARRPDDPRATRRAAASSRARRRGTVRRRPSTPAPGTNAPRRALLFFARDRPPVRSLSPRSPDAPQSRPPPPRLPALSSSSPRGRVGAHEAAPRRPGLRAEQGLPERQGQGLQRLPAVPVRPPRRARGGDAPGRTRRRAREHPRRRGIVRRDAARGPRRAPEAARVDAVPEPADRRRALGGAETVVASRAPESRRRLRRPRPAREQRRAAPIRARAHRPRAPLAVGAGGGGRGCRGGADGRRGADPPGVPTPRLAPPRRRFPS